MKIIENKEPVGFQPFDFTIRVESLDELKYLKALFHQYPDDVAKWLADNHMGYSFNASEIDEGTAFTFLSNKLAKQPPAKKPA